MLTDGYTLDIRVGILDVGVVEGEEVMEWLGGELELSRVGLRRLVAGRGTGERAEGVIRGCKQ